MSEAFYEMTALLRHLADQIDLNWPGMICLLFLTRFGRILLDACSVSNFAVSLTKWSLNKVFLTFLYNSYGNTARSNGSVEKLQFSLQTGLTSVSYYISDSWTTRRSVSCSGASLSTPRSTPWQNENICTSYQQVD